MPITKELYIIISLIFFGIYLISTYDIILQFQNFFRKKKIKAYIIEICFNVLQIFITIKFSQNIANGYIPAYFIIFLMIGVIIYYYTSRNFLKKEIQTFLKLYKKCEPKIKNFLKEFIYSKELINLIKKELKRYKPIFNKKKDKS